MATSSASRATAYLSCRGAQAALDWYAKVFKATELIRLADESGKVMHAEIQIGDASVMLADEFPQMGYVSPLSLNGSTVSIYVRVENVDEVFVAALDNGGIEVMPVTDHFDGDSQREALPTQRHLERSVRTHLVSGYPNRRYLAGRGRSPLL